jgi:hypothetical protein
MHAARYVAPRTPGNGGCKRRQRPALHGIRDERTRTAATRALSARHA